jgi:hypothetical protein
VEQELKLEEFRTLYRYYRRYVRVFDYLLLGFLVWIESKVIIQRVSNTVDQALDEYVVPPMPNMVTPIYTEKPSATSASLPEMRLTAPWYIESSDDKQPP